MRSPTSRCALGLLLAVAACLLLPPPSFGGGYAVSACFGFERVAWTEWEPSPFVTAYVACPGGVVDPARPQSGEGMMVRNVVGRGPAPEGAAAALAFDAPAGTSISGIDFDAKVLGNPGWQAGIQDGTHGVWLWCGAGCGSSFGLWIHQELRGLAIQRVQALVRCAAPRCRREARHGYIAVRNARVFLDDPSPPRIDGVRGSLVAAPGAWLRGSQDVAFDASDNGGILLGRVELDGRLLADDARACDFTHAVPCFDGPTAAAFDTRTWADGEHVLRLAAQDAGGNWSAAERTVRVDNTPPAEPAPALEGGDGWSARRTRRLVLPLPGGQAAPLTRARVKACLVGGPCSESAPELRAAGPSSAGAPPSGSGGPADSWSAGVPVEAFDGPGAYSLRVALEDAAGNVGPYAAPVTLRFDDARPGAPDLSAADAWHNGGSLPLSAEGEPPVSGIRGFRVRIGGSETIVATGLALDDLPEGATPVQVSTLSGASVASTAVRTTLKLDRSRPAAEVERAPEGWSREPVRLTLRGRDQPALSGVRALAWRLDGGDEATAVGDAATIDVASDGRHTLSYRAIDGAGNASEPHEVAVKVDRTPPERVVFEAPNPADPRRVRVVVADRVSGVASGAIELRRAGGDWRPVKTALETDTLVALLDDAVLRAGAYELRARVRDVAGNETVGTSRADGTPAVLTLPLRGRTALAVSRAGTLLRARLTAGGKPLGGREVRLTRRLRGRARWRAVCARRTVVIARTGGRPRGQLAVQPAAYGEYDEPRGQLAIQPAADGEYGEPRGQLAVRPAADGEYGEPRGQLAVQPADGCTLRTDAAGRVQVRLTRGPSRTLRMRFAGDALLLPAEGRAIVRTRARSRLYARPRMVRAGGAVTFTGRLRGGHVPRTGKLVELQARVASGWRTFATVRTDGRGRMRYTHRFATVSGGRTYRFRLRVRREAAYPFEGGASAAVAVRVL